MRILCVLACAATLATGAPATAATYIPTAWDIFPARFAPDPPGSQFDALRAMPDVRAEPPPASASLPLLRLALQTLALILASLALAGRLPRARSLPQVETAAPARSRTRWTIALRPFERWDDR